MLHYRALFGLLAVAAANPISTKCDNNTTMANSWLEVPVSADLKYIPCFQNFSCAYLQVPLDYDDPSAGTANIAFAKHSATVQPAKGDIIYNPGGPGESGVSGMYDALPSLIGLLGDSYNIIGMDPRGVSYSGPSVDCFPGSPSTRDLFLSTLDIFDPLSSRSLDEYYELSGAYGTWCSRVLNETARYVNTPATARDMLQYAEKLAESQGKNPKEALLNYYGISYGTTLGTTFAALYPDRVGRFIIDAVVDAEDHYFGNWSQNVLQADASMGAFFDLCAKAGPACALYGNGTTTGEQIKKRVDTIIAAVKEKPIPVTDPVFVDFPTTINHIDVQVGIQASLHEGTVLFPILAKGLVDLEQRNGSFVSTLSQIKGKVPVAACDKKAPETNARMSRIMIACNDNNKHYHHSRENLSKLFEYENSLSKYIGYMWTPIIIPRCRNLNFTPPTNQLFKGTAEHHAIFAYPG